MEILSSSLEGGESFRIVGKLIHNADALPAREGDEVRMEMNVADDGTFQLTASDLLWEEVIKLDWSQTSGERIEDEEPEVLARVGESMGICDESENILFVIQVSGIRQQG